MPVHEAQREVLYQWLDHLCIFLKCELSQDYEREREGGREGESEEGGRERERERAKRERRGERGSEKRDQGSERRVRESRWRRRG